MVESLYYHWVKIITLYMKDNFLRLKSLNNSVQRSKFWLSFRLGQPKYAPNDLIYFWGCPVENHIIFTTKVTLLACHLNYDTADELLNFRAVLHLLTTLTLLFKDTDCGFHTGRVCHVWCNFYPGYTCWITVTFGTQKMVVWKLIVYH